MALVTIEVVLAATIPAKAAAELIRLAEILDVRVRATLANGHIVFAEPGDSEGRLRPILETAMAHAS